MRRDATYRVQLHAGFGFDDAARIVPYLAELGISHLYTSPYLQAAPQSTHGYDVVDHGRVNRELGGEAAHRRMLDALKAAGMGHMVDVVPNHMSIASRENRWWWDVLKHGHASAYASYFDVEWDPPEERLRNVILLPVLADHYGRVLEQGEIRLHHENGELIICYAEHCFPVSPDSLEILGRPQGPPLQNTSSSAGAPLQPSRQNTPSSAGAPLQPPRQNTSSSAGAPLVGAPSGPGVDVQVAAINADVEKLHELLERQNYRLAWWQAAGRDLGYRRFFDVNSLIGLCVERDQVFRDTHRLVFRMLSDGDADGVRIDHPDGLRDPEAYLTRLHEAFPGAWVVAEKILEPGEELPEIWHAAGTTGYEFMNLAGGLFIDRAAEHPLTAFYAEFTGERTDWATIAHDRKLQVLRDVLGSDVSRLSELLLRICERHRRHRDYTRHQVTEVLRELLASFPVYRTYIRPVVRQVTDQDRHAIDTAVRRAREARPDLDATLLDFVRSIFLLEVDGDLEPELVIRFQQLSGPAMAKGIEDTAFYQFNRFVALNEVGSDPSRFGVAVEDFHQDMARRQARWPESLLASSTHDTKRGEDVRARLSVLSEMPEAWIAAVKRWAAINSPLRTRDLPDRGAEYLFYQTLVGAWPIDQERVQAYMEKAVREAKLHTSWLAPNEEYETALRHFIQGTLADESFITGLKAFVDSIDEAGRAVSLANTLLKITAPGVPDFYQGTELWSHVLVDPDNRRPVDYDERRRLLAELPGLGVDAVMARAAEGLPKLWLIRQGLALRARRSESFGAGSCHTPLGADGPKAGHVVAFMRGNDVISVAPRLMTVGGGGWGDTLLPLPSGGWTGVLTGEAFEGDVLLAALTRRFPVALLERSA